MASTETRGLEAVLRRLRTVVLKPDAPAYTPDCARTWAALCGAAADWIDASRANPEGGYAGALKGFEALFACLPAVPEITVRDLLEIESLGVDRLAIEAPKPKPEEEAS